LGNDILRGAATSQPSVQRSVKTTELSADDAHVAVVFRVESMFCISPYIAVACEVGAQVIKRLPDQEDCAVRRCFEKLPYNRLQVMHNLWGFGEIADDSVERHLIQKGIPMLRNQMHVSQQLSGHARGWVTQLLLLLLLLLHLLGGAGYCCRI
jgi:hypothetical protein